MIITQRSNAPEAISTSLCRRTFFIPFPIKAQVAISCNPSGNQIRLSPFLANAQVPIFLILIPLISEGSLKAEALHKKLPLGLRRERRRTIIFWEKLSSKHSSGSIVRLVSQRAKPKHTIAVVNTRCCGLIRHHFIAYFIFQINNKTSLFYQ